MKKLLLQGEEMNYKVGKIYKIKRGIGIKRDTYIFITGKDKLGPDPVVKYSFLHEIGIEHIIYPGVLKSYELELIS